MSAGSEGTEQGRRLRLLGVARGLLLLVVLALFLDLVPGEGRAPRFLVLTGWEAGASILLAIVVLVRAHDERRHGAPPLSVPDEARSWYGYEVLLEAGFAGGYLLSWGLLLGLLTLVPGGSGDVLGPGAFAALLAIFLLVVLLCAMVGAILIRYLERPLWETRNQMVERWG